MNHALFFLDKASKIKTFGDSMFPLLLNEDVVFFKKINFKRISVNDILIVKKGKDTFTHRVIYRTPSWLITKGDNNKISDGKIYPRNIFGKVYQVKRKHLKYSEPFNIEQTYLMQSTVYMQEIIKVKKLFEQNKVDYVFLKGLPLHLYFEKEHPKRLYLDCDLLLKKPDFAKAKKILEKMGYKKIINPISNTQEKLKDKEIEISYFKILKPGIRVVFDLHREIAFMMTRLGSLGLLYPQKLIDKLTNTFLKEKRAIKVQNEYFSILSPENLIIYLSLHFFHHNFNGIHRMAFLNNILRYEFQKIKNDEKRKKFILDVKEKIDYFQLGNFVYPSFLILDYYFKSRISDSFLGSFKIKRKIDIKSIKIFDDDERIEAGIKRFKNLFSLSPSPLFLKLLVLFKPSVLYSVSFSLYKIIINKLPL